MARGRTRSKGSLAALAIVSLALASPAAFANDTRAKTAPVAGSSYVTQAPIVMLKDMDSGAILFSRGAEKRFPPASMAKVMTAYVVLDLIESGELARDRQFTVGEATWKKWNSSTGGSTMFLAPNEKVSVDDLLKGLITVSGNDAAAVLAVGIDGSEAAFVKRMNVVAGKIGMTSSRFGTPSGWPDGGITQVSAADLVLLADRLISDHPGGYARYFSIPRFQHGKSPEGKPIIQPNRNPILGRFAGGRRPQNRPHVRGGLLLPRFGEARWPPPGPRRRGYEKREGTARRGRAADGMGVWSRWDARREREAAERRDNRDAQMTKAAGPATAEPCLPAAAFLDISG